MSHSAYWICWSDCSVPLLGIILNDCKWFLINSIAIHMAHMTVSEPVSDSEWTQMQHCYWIHWMLKLGLRQNTLSEKNEKNVQCRVTRAILTSARFVQRTPACLCMCVGGCSTVLSFGMLCSYLTALYK